MSASAKSDAEFFYIERHLIQDAKLHDRVLDDGDDDAARAISDKVARELGLSDDEIAALRRPRQQKQATGGNDGPDGLYTKREPFDESEHPRVPAGSPDGGQFTSGGGDAAGSKPTGPGQAGQADAAGPQSGRTGLGQSPRPYGRRSPGGAEGSRGIVAVYSLTADGKTAAAGAGITPLTFHELTREGSTRFHSAITAAKAASKYGAAVHAYPADDYRNMRLFLTADGQSGFALKGNDIVSAFKGAGSKEAKVADSVLALAIQEGGRKLDAFDTVLPDIYSNSGFRAVARIPWDDNEKPPGWSYETFAKFDGGRPDVVFMVHDPEHARPYEKGDGQKAASYDVAVATQTKVLERLARERAAKFSPGVKAANNDETARLVKESWVAASPYKGEKLDAAVAAASAAQDQLGKVGPQIAKKLGLPEFKNPGIKKDRERIEQKYRDRGNNAARVTDLVRATFIVERPEQADEIADALGQHFEVIAENWKVTPVKYSDKALLVRFDNGMIGEVQVMDRKMADAKSPDKGGGHDLYKAQRSLDPVKDATRYAALTAQQVALYGAVLASYDYAWKAALGIAGSSG